MKVVVTIEFEKDELTKLVTDAIKNNIHPEVKVWGKVKEGGVKRLIEPVKVKNQRDKLCKSCGDKFTDETPRNNRRFCTRCKHVNARTEFDEVMSEVEESQHKPVEFS